MGTGAWWRSWRPLWHASERLCAFVLSGGMWVAGFWLFAPAVCVLPLPNHPSFLPTTPAPTSPHPRQSHLTPSTSGGGLRQPSISIPSGLRTEGSADLGWSIGSSDADLAASTARSSLADLRRQQQDLAGGGVRAGAQGGGSAPPSLAASLSFQSLLASGDSGDHQLPGGGGAAQQQIGGAAASAVAQHQQQQQQQQQQQHGGRRQARLSQQSPERVGPVSELEQQQEHLDSIGGSAAATVSAAPAAVPPELQSMIPSAGSGGLAPQLWPRASPQQKQQPQQQQGQHVQQQSPDHHHHHQQQQQQQPAPEQPPEFLVIGGSPEPPDSGTYGEVEVLGMALLHPKLSGQTVGGFTRLLARAKLGRAMLRPLLRTEIGGWVVVARLVGGLVWWVG